MPELKVSYIKDEGNNYISPITSAKTVLLSRKEQSVEDFSNDLLINIETIEASVGNNASDILSNTTKIDALQTEATDKWALLNTVDSRSNATETASSTHISNKNNPHSVTATQIGAEVAGAASAVQTNLTAHIGNVLNPHSTTASQIGADPSGTASSAVSTHNTALDAHSTKFSGYVPTARTINNKSLLSDIVLTASDVGADASGLSATVQTNLTTHNSNTTVHITSTERTAWNAGASNASTALTSAATAATAAETAQTTANGKEPAITVGLVTSFWSGLKTWVDFATTVRAVVLTGLSTATSAVISVTDTVLSALGKLQAQITSHINNASNPHSVTATQVGLGSVTNESKETMFANAALTGAPTATTAVNGANTTQIATTAFVQTAISSSVGGAMTWGEIAGK